MHLNLYMTLNRLKLNFFNKNKDIRSCSTLTIEKFQHLNSIFIIIILIIMPLKQMYNNKRY